MLVFTAYMTDISSLLSLHLTSMYFVSNFFRESANSLYLDLVFDESSFEKFFQKIDPTSFERDGQPAPLREGEIKLPSLKIIDKDFLY